MWHGDGCTFHNSQNYSIGSHFPTSKGCKWIQKQVSVTLGVTTQEKQWVAREAVGAETHKSVEHYPKVVLLIIQKEIISKMPS